MLVKFAVTNYRGFADRIEWDLSSPANYEFNKNAIKDGIIKMVLYMDRTDRVKQISVWLYSILRTICHPNGRR